MTQRKLSSYDETGTRRPFLHSDASVRVRLPDKGEILAGYRGPVPARQAYGFVQFCTRDSHRIRALDAYALSETLLTRIRKLGCKVVLFAETDTGTVYEFHERQFTEAVPRQYNPVVDDPQRYVALDTCWASYPDHTEQVLLK